MAVRAVPARVPAAEPAREMVRRRQHHEVAVPVEVAPLLEHAPPTRPRPARTVRPGSATGVTGGATPAATAVAARSRARAGSCPVRGSAHPS